MDKKFILELVKNAVPELKAQVAEQLKVQGAENATINITLNLHTGDINNVTVNVPLGTDLSKIASTEITPEIENKIQQRTLEDLSAQQAQLESLPDREVAMVVANSTLASMGAVVSDQVKVTEKLDVKITPPSTK